jgi:hypothetical protein
MMFDYLKRRFAAVLSKFKGRKRPAGRTIRRCRPQVEGLEERLTPATPPPPASWTWTGAVSATASNGMNWINDSTGNNGVPQAGDNVSYIAGTNNQYNRPCTIDQAFVGQLGSVTIYSSYTNTITLQRNLTVTTTTQSNGVIAGSATYEVPNGGNYYWYGGTLQGGGNLNTDITQIDAGSTMTVAGTAPNFNFNGTIEGRNLINSGTLNVSAPNGGGVTNTITVINNGELNNAAGGLIDMFSGGNLGVNNDVITGDTSGMFGNAGTVKVETDVQATIDINSSTTGRGSYLAFRRFLKTSKVEIGV